MTTNSASNPTAERLCDAIEKLFKERAEIDQKLNKIFEALGVNCLRAPSELSRSPEISREQALAQARAEIRAENRRLGTIMGSVIEILQESPEPWVPLKEVVRHLEDRCHEVKMTSLSPQLSKHKKFRREGGKLALVARLEKT